MLEDAKHGANMQAVSDWVFVLFLFLALAAVPGRQA